MAIPLMVDGEVVEERALPSDASVSTFVVPINPEDPIGLIPVCIGRAGSQEVDRLGFGRDHEVSARRHHGSRRGPRYASATGGACPVRRVVSRRHELLPGTALGHGDDLLPTVSPPHGSLRASAAMAFRAATGSMRTAR